MARRVVFKEGVLSQSPNPSGPYRFVGYDGLTFSQLDNSGNITPIGGGNGTGGGETVGASNGLSLSGSSIILGGTMSNDTTINGENTRLVFDNFNRIIATMSNRYSFLAKNTEHYSGVGGQNNQVSLDAQYYILGPEISATSSKVNVSFEGVAITARPVDTGISGLYVNIQSDSIDDGSTNNTIIVHDNLNSKGMVYNSDYSANFTTYSLVTKGYVDAGTSSIFSTLSVSSYDYTEVNISSSQLLNIGTSPVTLLAAPGANKYYDFDKIIFEFTYGTITYNCPSKLFIVGYATPTIKIAYIDLSQLVSQPTNRISIVEPTKPDNYDIGGGILVNTHLSIELNEALLFTTIGLDDLTFGDGTMKVKIWYKVRNFG